MKTVTTTIVLAGLAVTLAGCGLETKDYTSHEKAQTQTSDYNLGDVAIRNAYVTTSSATLLATPSTSATPTPAKSVTSYVVATLINKGRQPETFSGVSTSLGTAAFAGTAAGSSGVTLPPGVPVQVATTAISPTATLLKITGLAPPVGGTVPMQFAFTGAGRTPTISVPVLPPGQTLSPTRVIPTDQATPPPQDAPPAVD